MCARQGAGTTVPCWSAIPFSKFYLFKAVFIYTVRSPRFTPSTFFYTWSVVSSPHFIRSPCFKPSPQSTFYTDRFKSTLSRAPVLSCTHYFQAPATQAMCSDKVLPLFIMLIQSPLRLSSTLTTLAHCKASKGILSLKLAFGPALWY